MEGCAGWVRGRTSRMILDSLEIEINQADFRHHPVSSIKEFRARAKISSKGKMD